MGAQLLLADQSPVKDINGVIVVSDMAESCIAEPSAQLSLASEKPDSGASEVNSMKLNLQAGSLSVQIETKVVASREIIELSTKLDVTMQILRETQEQLCSALKRVGYLEGILRCKEAV